MGVIRVAPSSRYSTQPKLGQQPVRRILPRAEVEPECGVGECPYLDALFHREAGMPSRIPSSDSPRLKVLPKDGIAHRRLEHHPGLLCLLVGSGFRAFDPLAPLLASSPG